MIEDGEIYTLQIDGQNKTEMENTIRKDKLNQPVRLANLNS